MRIAKNLKCVVLAPVLVLMSCVSTTRSGDATVVYTSAFLGTFRTAHLQLPIVSLATPGETIIQVRDLPFAVVPTEVQVQQQKGDTEWWDPLHTSLPWNDCELTVSIASPEGTEVYSRNLRLGNSPPSSAHPSDFDRRGERNYYSFSLFYPPYPVPESELVSPLRSYSVIIIVHRPSTRPNDCFRLVGDAPWAGSEYVQMHDAVKRGGT